MPWLELVGYTAGILTTSAVIPQIVKAWKTRHVDDISVFMVVILICGVALWTLYGIGNRHWPIIIANGVSVLLNCSLLALVIVERRKRR
jgi:MtN3 and saliva related transmembrane protein